MFHWCVWALLNIWSLSESLDEGWLESFHKRLRLFAAAVVVVVGSCEGFMLALIYLRSVEEPRAEVSREKPLSRPLPEDSEVETVRRGKGEQGEKEGLGQPGGRLIISPECSSLCSSSRPKPDWLIRTSQEGGIGAVFVCVEWGRRGPSARLTDLQR